MRRRDLCELWAIVDRKRFRILEHLTRQPIHTYQQIWSFGNYKRMALSPDGRSVAVILPFEKIPPSWSAYRSSPLVSSDAHLQAASQNTSAPDFADYAEGYFKVDLMSGNKMPLVDAPIGWRLNWENGPLTAVWSETGEAIALSNVFLPLTGPQLKKRTAAAPCIAVVRLVTRKVDCVSPLLGTTFYKERSAVVAMRFSPTSDQALSVVYGASSGERRIIDYVQVGQSRWSAFRRNSTTESELTVRIQQDMNHPPVLTACGPKGTVCRSFYDPNVFVNSIQLTTVEQMQWRDAKGVEWSGGLLKPAGYEPGKRYPFVILTHGFAPDTFLTSPWTVMIDRPLAAAGFVVLQVGDVRGKLVTLGEVSAQLDGYNSAIKLLADKNLIDVRRIGIIGFSRSVHYVMAALTRQSAPFAAASISDGVDGSYWQYIFTVDYLGNSLAHEYDIMFGGPPFGQALGNWFARSPAFNLEKVHAPMLLLEPGVQVALSNWDVYSSLRYLGRPVELINLGEGTHPLSNPRQRLAAEVANLDWFRFWLQGYEDREPKKRDQYLRWEKLCDLQIHNDPTLPHFCVATAAKPR